MTTSLSAGLWIYQQLQGIEAAVVAVTDTGRDTRLPYVAYRRTALEAKPVKSCAGPETATYEVACYAQGYGESVELAEEVRARLDRAQGSIGSLVIRSCLLVGAEEDWENDAYAQRLEFEVRC